MHDRDDVSVRRSCAEQEAAVGSDRCDQEVEQHAHPGGLPQVAVFDYFVEPELLVRWMGDFARLEASSGGLFSVDIYGVLIRGHFVRVERPHLIEIAWGEADNEAMPPGATRLVVTFEARGDRTLVQLEHSGLVPAEAKKHAIGWPHFIERLGVAARGDDPRTDPWKTSPPQ